MKLKRRDDLASRRRLAMVVAASDPAGRRRTGRRTASIGLAVMAGGGVTDFTQGATRNETTVGGSWDVRALVGTRTWIGFEASYIGGANPIKALGAVRQQQAGAQWRRGGPSRAAAALLTGSRCSSRTSSAASAGTPTGSRTSTRTARASRPTATTRWRCRSASASWSATKDSWSTCAPRSVPTYRQTILGNQGATGLTNWDAGAMIGFEF